MSLASAESPHNPHSLWRGADEASVRGESQNVHGRTWSGGQRVARVWNALGVLLVLLTQAAAAQAPEDGRNGLHPQRGADPDRPLSPSEYWHTGDERNPGEPFLPRVITGSDPGLSPSELSQADDSARDPIEPFLPRMITGSDPGLSPSELWHADDSARGPIEPRTAQEAPAPDMFVPQMGAAPELHPGTTTPRTTGPREQFATKHARYVPVSWEELPGWREAATLGAWSAFAQGCAVLSRRQTWRETCERASVLRPATAAVAREFFEREFEAFQIRTVDRADTGTLTGYYEPSLDGSRVRTARFRHPVYAVPEDLLFLDARLVASRRAARLRPARRTRCRTGGPKHLAHVAQRRPEGVPARGRSRSPPACATGRSASDAAAIASFRTSLARKSSGMGSPRRGRSPGWTMRTCCTPCTSRARGGSGCPTARSCALPLANRMAIASAPPCSSNQRGPREPMTRADSRDRRRRRQVVRASSTSSTSSFPQRPRRRVRDGDDARPTLSAAPFGRTPRGGVERDRSKLRLLPADPEYRFGARQGRWACRSPRGRRSPWIRRSRRSGRRCSSPRGSRARGTRCNRLMVAQDTGGAIRGALRADYFLGSGPAAGAMANRMKDELRMWILLPKELAIASRHAASARGFGGAIACFRIRSSVTTSNQCPTCWFGSMTCPKCNPIMEKLREAGRGDSHRKAVRETASHRLGLRSLRKSVGGRVRCGLRQSSHLLFHCHGERRDHGVCLLRQHLQGLLWPHGRRPAHARPGDRQSLAAQLSARDGRDRLRVCHHRRRWLGRVLPARGRGDRDRRLFPRDLS